MHPLARIHPSYRTAFIAFLVARAAVWLGLDAAGKLAFARLDAGTPLYRLIVEGIGPLWSVALAEALLFFGVVAVYRFARRDGMPQTADRAAWLWIGTPAMVFAVPGGDFTMAYGLAALAMGAILHPVWSAVALSLAIALRPEAIIVWPAIAWAWWAYRDGDPLNRLALAVVPAAVFAATVLGGVLVAGEPTAIFEGSASLRTNFEWLGFWHHSSDLIIGGFMLCAVAIALRMGDETPRGWLWATLPVVLLVAMHDPMIAGLGVLPFGVPIFVQLAKFTQSADFERILLAGSLVGLALLAAT